VCSGTRLPGPRLEHSSVQGPVRWNWPARTDWCRARRLLSNRGDGPILRVTGRDGSGQLAAWMRFAVVDGQCVQDALPGVDPPGRVRSVRPPLGGDEVEDLERRLLVGEVTLGDGPPCGTGVEALNGIGRVHDRSQLDGEREERGELGPGPFPRVDQSSASQESPIPRRSAVRFRRALEHEHTGCRVYFVPPRITMWRGAAGNIAVALQVGVPALGDRQRHLLTHPSCDNARPSNPG
jgi:hypothetical protein